MIGMVLAAGAGRRLRPYTDTLPKALVPVVLDAEGDAKAGTGGQTRRDTGRDTEAWVAGRDAEGGASRGSGALRGHGDTTIFDIALHNLAEVGLTDVVVVVGYHAGAVEQRKAALERRHGVRLTLVHNDKAEEWNNAYSMWLARNYFGEGVLMVNGDTVHPVSVEKTLLGARGPDIVLAIDDVKRLGEEEMKVTLDAHGHLVKITKLMDPAVADGEYIGATLIEPAAAQPLADALEATWRGDPDLYYEDGYQELVNRGGKISVVPIGAVEWVEVDNHDDLVRAREIACRY